MNKTLRGTACIIALCTLFITLYSDGNASDPQKHDNKSQHQEKIMPSEKTNKITNDNSGHAAKPNQTAISRYWDGFREAVGDTATTNTLLVVFTFLLVLGTGWGIRAANAAKKSADVMVAQTRPHVFVKVWTGIADPKEDGNRGFGFDCKCLLMNQGSVVAVPEIFHLTSNFGLREPVTEIRNGEYIPIGGFPTKKTAEFRLVFSPGEWANIENGWESLIVSGHLQYSDMISRKSKKTFFEFTLDTSKRHFIQTESKKKNRRT